MYYEQAVLEGTGEARHGDFAILLGQKTDWNHEILSTIPLGTAKV
mgnify:CR=1 FL=1